MNCKACGRKLPPANPRARRKREFCNGACKQAYYRQTHSTIAQQTANAGEQSDLKAELEEARLQIAELTEENRALRSKLDIERRYLEDRAQHGFKAWLRRQGDLPEAEKFLGELVPPRGRRSQYVAYFRMNRYSREDIERFQELWKLMLSQVIT